MTRCVKCEAEGLDATKICPNCGVCRRHKGCACIQCRMCKKFFGPKAFCPRCNHCKEHHIGRIFEADEFVYRTCEYKKDTSSDEAPSYFLNNLPRSLGVEIELGNFGQFTANSVAKFKHILPYYFEHDGSVSGSGKELVTKPLTGDQYIHGMVWLVKQLQEYKTQANHTCGYHVHVDAVDLSPEGLRKVLIAYTLLQPQLYGTLIAKTRLTSEWGKTYCPPLNLNHTQLLNFFELTDTGEINNWFNQYLYQMQYPEEKLKKEDPAYYKQVLQDIQARLKELKAKKYVNSARRSALNFHSWMMRGTIEFRLKEGTTDPTDLLMWPLWCGWFIQKVSSMQDKELMYWFKEIPSLLEVTTGWTEDKILPAPQALVKYIQLRMEAAPKTPKDEPHASGEPDQRSAVNILARRALSNLDNSVTVPIGPMPSRITIGSVEYDTTVTPWRVISYNRNPDPWQEPRTNA